MGKIVGKIPYIGAYAPSGIRTHDPLITIREHDPFSTSAPTELKNRSVFGGSHTLSSKSTWLLRYKIHYVTDVFKSWNIILVSHNIPRTEICRILPSVRGELRNMIEGDRADIPRHTAERTLIRQLMRLYAESRLRSRANSLLKPKRHSLRCHDFVVHALLLRMHTNVVDFRVMRRLCRRE